MFATGRSREDAGTEAYFDRPKHGSFWNERIDIRQDVEDNKVDGSQNGCCFGVSSCSCLKRSRASPLVERDVQRSAVREP